MSINLNQLVQGALTEGVLQQLAGRIGCAPEAAKRVASLCAPALIGSMMNKASSLEGARSLFSAIMAPTTNAQIADELPHFVVHDEGFRSLVDAGEKADGALASHDSLNLLAERMSEYTGVAASATRMISGVVGATVLGVLKRYFTQQNGQIGHLPTLLGHQLPVVRANMTDAFASALGLGSVGAFLAGVASRLKAVSAHLEHPVAHQATAFPIHVDGPPPVTVAVEEQKEKSSNKKAWMWVASAAALALFAALASRGCSTDKPAQDAAADTSSDAGTTAAASDSAAPVALASAASDASLPMLMPGKSSIMTTTVDASGIPTLKATVNSEEERQRLIDLLTAKLGADKFHANITVDPDTKSASWLDKLDGLLPVLTQPGAKVSIVGDKISLSGSAADSKFGWLDKLKALFGSGWTVATANALPQAAPAVVADTGAKQQCDASNVIHTLNLKPINFRTGAVQPPAAAMTQLSKSAQAIKECDTATPIKLQIAGYSDNTGSKALNLQLSKKRAEAVKSFLVKRGVPATALTVQAFGDAYPIADNKTATGRMANRRIEFKEAN